MTTRKVHLRANKALDGQRVIARCAARSLAGGKVGSNGRQTYRFMASEIVSFEAFRATPAADRCAHCCDVGLQVRNRQRRDKGLAPVASLFDFA